MLPSATSGLSLLCATYLVSSYCSITFPESLNSYSICTTRILIVRHGSEGFPWNEMGLKYQANT